MMPIYRVEFNDCVRLVIDSRPFRHSHLQEKPINTGLIISNLLDCEDKIRDSSGKFFHLLSRFLKNLMSKFLLFFAVNVQNMPLDSYSGNVDNEIKLLRNIRIFNLLSQVFLSKTGIAGYYATKARNIENSTRRRKERRDAARASRPDPVWSILPSAI